MATVVNGFGGRHFRGIGITELCESYDNALLDWLSTSVLPGRKVESRVFEPGNGDDERTRASGRKRVGTSAVGTVVRVFEDHGGAVLGKRSLR
jgi:hypothetical protein